MRRPGESELGGEGREGGGAIQSCIVSIEPNWSCVINVCVCVCYVMLCS